MPGPVPITRTSGKKKAVLARYVHNNRLIDALSLDPPISLSKWVDGCVSPTVG